MEEKHGGVEDVESNLRVEMEEKQVEVEDVVEGDLREGVEEKFDEVEDVASDSSNSFIDDGDDDDDEPSAAEQEDEPLPEEPLTEKEIDELVDDFLEVESKAAEAQEALEEESLAKLGSEVREELAQTLKGDELEAAVADEMTTYREEWEATLDELETESAHLLEQLDGAGVELPSLYKWIESQAPNGCCTEAWKQRVHWVGSQVTDDVNESVAGAEKHLQSERPVRRRHGKLLEEGASGFLQKKLTTDESKDNLTDSAEVDWCSFNKILSGHESQDGAMFGSKQWASVYLASTPQQAAVMGLAFPGVNEVEEIDDIDDAPSDPFVADAVANEKDPVLSEEQLRNFRKVKEEDDANLDRKLQLHLKRRRHRKICKQDVMRKEVPLVQDEYNFSSPVSNGKINEDDESMPNCDDKALKTDIAECPEASNNNNDTFSLPHSTESRGSKRSSDNIDLTVDNKSKTVIIDIDDDHPVNDKKETVAADSLPSHVLEEKFNCTACARVAVEVHSHPLLKVIICRDCKCLVEQKMNIKDSDCSECFCGWCGRSSDFVSCKSCETLFCNTCIKRNLGEDCLSAAHTSGWLCCCCSPSLLQQLTSELEQAMGSEGVAISSTLSDSDSSDTDINAAISSKRKQKKRIRRILDDAELGEETKRKIAIEKERQEHLKSLQAQFSSKSKLMSSSSFNYNLPAVSTAEVLGDASTGYIMNVVREKGEDPVRIPSSISAKLKAHQIAGIRFMWENVMLRFSLIRLALQIAGIQFMWENVIQSITRVKSGDKGLGCILAHTMGLGKTFQVIAFLYTAMRSIDLGLRTALIVTPVNVLHNWRHEFLKWRPSELKPLRVYMLDDISRDRRAELLAKWRTKGGVFLIGYTAFRNLSLGKNVKDCHMAGEIRFALQDGPDILVCDEAHIIKNHKADTTQALKLVKCQRRIALTGSPLQNNLMEYYCMVDFVREGFLGSNHEFRNRFQNPIENGQHTNSTSNDVKIMNQRSHILYEQLKGFVQRMDMNVVKKDLPPKTVFVIAVKLSPIQRKLYKRFIDAHGFTKDKVSNEKMRKSFFAGYQALAQIWNHPWILQLRKDRDYVGIEDEDCSSDENVDYNMVTGEKLRNTFNLGQGKNDNGIFQKDWCNDLLRENNYKELHYSGKMVLLFDILTMSSEVGDKALVFSQSILTLDLIELYLARFPRHGKRGKLWKKGKDWYRLDGSTASSDRQKIVENFNDPLNKRVKCVLISTRAGSLGINLHSANRVIIVDGSWNPTYDLQAIYRAWRYGQTKPVYAYRLLAHATMEEKIYKRQVTKEGLAARVVDRQQVHRTISKEEMLHLFEFGDDESPDSLSEAGPENGNSSKQKEPLSRGSCTSDKFMENLLGKHYPRWISTYHEHETLLQENEEEKLSKEEQDMAWEVYQKSLEWQEVPQVPLDESTNERNPDVFVKPDASSVKPESSTPEAAIDLARSKSILRSHSAQRKCTNLSHMLTLRSQGTKSGCSTICGECAQEISWEDLNRDRKQAK